MLVKKSGEVCGSPHSAVNGEANQISAANQHFISGAIWPSANCVSFKSLSISGDPPSTPFSPKNAFEPSFWLQGGDLHVVGWGWGWVGGCLLTALPNQLY